MIAGLLSLSTASAGLVLTPPAGVSQIAVHLCGDAPECDQQRAWLNTREEPVLPARALVETDPAAPSPMRLFAEHLEAGRDAVAAGDWEAAVYALDRAEYALEQATECPDSRDLFDLYYLRGAARSMQPWEGARDDLFLEAAALSWNRIGLLHDPEAPWVEAYYDAAERLLAAPPGTLVLAGDARYTLDGIALGPGPHEVLVMPGTHLICARSEDGLRSWRRVLDIESASRRVARASLLDHHRPEQVLQALLQAHSTLELDAEVGDLLRSWSTEHGQVRLQLLVLEPDGFDYRMKTVLYDPIAHVLISPEAP